MKEKAWLKLGLLQENPSESSSYIATSKQTNHIDFLKLFDGHEEFYLLPAKVTELKKKHVIITDPSLAFELITDKNNLTRLGVLWFGLIQQGFSVSVWTGKELLQVKKALDLIPALKKIKAIHHQDLIEILAEQGIASKDCYLAGMKQTQELLFHYEGELRCIIDADQLMALSDRELESLLESLTGTPPIAIELNEQQLAALSKNQHLIACLERNPVFYFNLPYLELDSSLLSKEVEFEALLPIAILFKHLTVRNFTTTEETPPLTISELLRYFPAIEVLELNDFDDLEKLPKNLPLWLTLKKICLPYSNIPWQQMSQFLQSCPSIEALDLPGRRQLSALPDDLFLPPTLRIINLENSELPLRQVSQLLQSCPSIEELNLSSYVQLHTSLEDLSLPNTLKKISLSSTYITWQQVSELLQSCPSIEELDLTSNYKLGEGDLFLPATLKKIILGSISITWQQVSQLLQSCPAIEELDLSGCEISGEFPNNLFLSSTLTKISLAGATVTWEQVSQIIQSSSSLEEVDLEDCCHLGKLPEELTFLSQIKTLNLREQVYFKSIILKEDVDRIKTKFPNLITNREDEFGVKYEMMQGNFNQKTTSVKEGLQLQDEEPWLDNDTADENKTLRARQIFENINPAHYRSRCYPYVYIDEYSVRLLKFSLPHEPYQLALATDAPSYTGLIEFAQSDDWIALPTLTADDKLIDLHTFPEIDVEIHHHPLEGIYYIKPMQALDNQSIVVSYTIESNYSQEEAPLYEVPSIIDVIRDLTFDEEGKLIENGAFKVINQLKAEEKLLALIAYFNRGEAKVLDSDEYGYALLNAIIRQNIGACRHRVMAFMALAEAFELRVNAIYNDLHAFVEVMINDKWQRADLGGSAVRVEILPRPELTSEVKETQKTEESHLLEVSPDNPFRKWDTNEIAADSMNEYVDQLLTQADALDPGRKNALSILDRAQIPAFYTALFQQKKNNCFYLPNLSNIKEEQTIIDNETGRLLTKDSALKQFLQQAKPGDVLLVNWLDYQAEQVGYNSIVDSDHRRIKGMTIPEGVVVMSLLGHSQMMREDFYSRFRLISDSKATLTSKKILPQPKKTIQPDEKPLEEICFYDDAWRSVLLGQITATNGHYQISSSPLLDAIHAGKKSIVLRNAPWALPDFQLFITELLARRRIEVNGKSYDIPEDFHVLRSDLPYSFESIPYTVEAYSQDTSLQDAYVLNSMTFNSLFQQVQAKQHQLNTMPGLLATHQDQPLKLFVTQTLTDLQWARINNEVNKHGTLLHVVLARGVRLPTHRQIVSTETLQAHSIRLIETNDPDFVSSELPEDTLIIPVNEKTTYVDLTGTQKVRKHGDEISCEYLPGILTSALQSGKKVVLKGRLSDALAQELSPVFLRYLSTNGKREENLTGELTFLVDSPAHFGFVSSETRTIHENEIWDKLYQVNADNAKILQAACHALYQRAEVEPFQYTQLMSMLTYLQQHPQSNPLKQLLRASADYVKLKPIIEATWREAHPGSGKKSKQPQPVLQKRQNALENRLENAWYVCVAGSSGVGKSTTINQAMKTLGYQPVTQAGSLQDKLKAWLEPGEKDHYYLMRPIFMKQVNSIY